MVDEGKAERLNQFARPHGAMGHVVGWLMAAFNSDMERCAVDALGLHGTESALEIGFGPGVGVARLARRLPGGRVAGIDPSVVMLSQASRRNRRAIQAGPSSFERGPRRGCRGTTAGSTRSSRSTTSRNGRTSPTISPRSGACSRPEAGCRSASTGGSTSTPRIAVSRPTLGRTSRHRGRTCGVHRRRRASRSGHVWPRLYLVADVASQRDAAVGN